MDLWLFWGIAALLSLAVAVLLVRAMLGQAAAGTGPVAIYRDQLAELDRDVARGTLGQDEAERARLEVSRRLLDADRARASARPVRRGGIALGAGAVIVLTAASVVVYARLGAPGYADLPQQPRLAAIDAARMARPDQTAAEAHASAPVPQTDPDFAALVAQLRLAVERNPNDLRGQRLLARNEAVMGEFARAVAAQKQVIALQDTAPAADYAQLAELLAYAAGGYISPEGEVAIRKALSLDPDDARALYLSGLMMAQGGRDDLAFRDWTRALDVAPSDALWRDGVLQAMPQIAAQAGQRWTSPAPSQADAIRALPRDEQDAAIAGMVEGLAARLDAEGGSAEDWARLINAYGVLGRTDDARAAVAKAEAAHPDDPAVKAAAAGVAP